MVLVSQLIGALLGLLAVVFGAFGAHLLKKLFTVDQLNSFETGVKYQMYHALIILMLSFNFNLESSLEKNGLCISAAKGKKLKILGPITPLGGLFLVIGWGLLLYHFIKNFI